MQIARAKKQFEKLFYMWGNFANCPSKKTIWKIVLHVRQFCKLPEKTIWKIVSHVRQFCKLPEKTIWKIVLHIRQFCKLPEQKKTIWKIVLHARQFCKLPEQKKQFEKLFYMWGNSANCKFILQARIVRQFCKLFCSETNCKFVLQFWGPVNQLYSQAGTGNGKFFHWASLLRM